MIIYFIFIMKNIITINLILGLWVAISPWLSSKSLTLSNVIVGITIALLGVIGLAIDKKDKDDENQEKKTEEKEEEAEEKPPIVEEVKTTPVEEVKTNSTEKQETE